MHSRKYPPWLNTPKAINNYSSKRSPSAAWGEQPTMSFRYIGPGGPAGPRAPGSDVSAGARRQAGHFSVCRETTEGQRATKIRLARKVFLRVAEKNWSWYLYCFMGVEPHSVQIRRSKPAQGLHIITEVDAVNPDGCTLLNAFYGCLFHRSSVWMNILNPPPRSAPQKTVFQVTRLEQEIVGGSTYALFSIAQDSQHDFIVRNRWVKQLVSCPTLSCLNLTQKKAPGRRATKTAQRG